jgi:glycosyltransferase involved in cell wall biosynthesis
MGFGFRVTSGGGQSRSIAKIIVKDNENGFLFTGDSENMAKAIIKILKNKKIANRMGKNPYKSLLSIESKKALKISRNL